MNRIFPHVESVVMNDQRGMSGRKKASEMIDRKEVSDRTEMIVRTREIGVMFDEIAIVIVIDRKTTIEVVVVVVAVIIAVAIEIVVAVIVRI